MAKSKRLTKQDLREPDEVFQASAAGLQWFQERWLIIALGFVVLFGGGIGLALYSHFQFQSESEAQAHLSEAANHYQQWSLAEGDDKVAAREELQAELKKIADDYSSSKAFQLASVYRARLALFDQKWDLAIEEYQSYEAALPSADKALAWFALAKVNELRQDWSEALSRYDQILQNEDSVFRKDALMGKARSLRQLQKIEEAKAVYESFLREFPSSQEASLVRGYMTLSDEWAVGTKTP